jgi:hypothetical protein
MSDLKSDILNYGSIYEQNKKIFDRLGIEPRNAIKHALKVLHVEDKFGFEFANENIGSDWFEVFDFCNNIHVGFYDGERRFISCSDNGKQPKNEWLLKISFSTGAYFFSQKYPEKLFDRFFDELKAYEPKYIDTVNHALYFSPEKSSKIVNDYQSIVEKYRADVKAEVKEIEIKLARENLERLLSDE